MNVILPIALGFLLGGLFTPTANEAVNIKGRGFIDDQLTEENHD